MSFDPNGRLSKLPLWHLVIYRGVYAPKWAEEDGLGARVSVSQWIASNTMPLRAAIGVSRRVFAVERVTWCGGNYCVCRGFSPEIMRLPVHLNAATILPCFYNLFHLCYYKSPNMFSQIKCKFSVIISMHFLLNKFPTTQVPKTKCQISIVSATIKLC